MFGRFKNEVLYPWVGKLSIYETIRRGLDPQGRLRMIICRMMKNTGQVTRCVGWQEGWMERLGIMALAEMERLRKLRS